MSQQLILNTIIQLRPATIADLATNDRTQRFYERLSFKFVEQKRLSEDKSDCFVFEVRREDGGKTGNFQSSLRLLLKHLLNQHLVRNRPSHPSRRNGG